MALLFTFTILPIGAYSLTYDYYEDNGSWNEYANGLGTFYYQDVENDMTTYNRDFETDYSFSTNGFSCSEAEWCAYLNNDSTMSRSSDYAYNGSYSNRMALAGNATVWLFGNNEILGDVNVSFYVRQAGSGTGRLRYGYVDDETNYTDSFNNLAGATYGDTLEITEDWTQYTFEIPKGQYRVAFASSEISGLATQVYIDYVTINRTNTGTFRVNNEPEYCSSIESCSNRLLHFPSNQLGQTYPVVDYVADASCSYSILEDGVILETGGMVEGTNGMYYAPIDVQVNTGHYRDVNVLASCSKIPFSTKSFFAELTLQRYNNVENGNFETDFDLIGGLTPGSYGTECGSDWCLYANSGTTFERDKTISAKDGRFQGFIDGVASSTATLYSESEEVGGYTVSFWAKKGENAINGFTAGYVNDSNSYTSVLDIGTLPRDWNYYSYEVPSGSYRFALQALAGGSGSDFFIDNISSSGAKQESDLVAGNNLTNNFGLRGETYLFTSEYENAFDNPITDADCNLTIGSTDYSMTYNSTTEQYEYSTAFVSDGTYSIEHSCSSDSFNDQSESYAVEIVTPASDTITFTPISNISSYEISDFSNEISFVKQNNEDPIIFSIVSQEEYAPYFVFNSYDENNYHVINVSDDGDDYVFNETLTYGESSNFDDPLQRIPFNNYFENSFSGSLTAGTIKYYKIDPITPPVKYDTIGESDDWIHFNKPTSVIGGNNNSWDLFQDSNYTNIRSESLEFIPELTSTDLNTGFEFIFTAYASESKVIEVGYTYSGIDISFDVNLGTGVNTYSVPIDPTDYESRLLIKSSSTNDARVYIGDYALMPKAYFTDRLSIYDETGDDLDAILYGGVSDIYVREGYPLQIETSAYDREGDLSKLRIESLVGSTVVRSYEFDISDATEENKKFTWRKSIEAIIDLNGYYGNPVGFRTATFKATLINNSGEEVSEQFKTVRLMQFPYYPDDIGLSLSSLNSKVGTNPKIQFLLNTLNPGAIIGLDLKIYDVNHSVTDPNYSKIIYPGDIGCSNYVYCTKNILVDDWVYEQATDYTVRLTTLLNTENTTYNNPLTSKFITVSATSGTLGTARLLQVYERRGDLNKSYYTQTEPIPLVFQARDDLFRNLQDDVLPYIQVDYYSDWVTKDSQDTKFYPIKHYYDNATGYNYWFWNRYFYLDNGDLFDSNSQIDFKVSLEVSNDTLSGTNSYSLSNKCASYPTKYNPATFLMDWSGRSVLDDFECVTNVSSTVMLYGGSSQRIDINANYTPASEQTQNVLCVRANEPFNPRDDFGDDFACALLITKSEEQIDTINVTIGNDATDIGITGNTKQYINFGFSVDDLLFNDVWATATTLTAPNSVESVGNIGDLLYSGFSEIIPSAMNDYDDFSDWFANASFQKNTAFDTNFFANIHDLSSVAFFKVRGLKVINQYDYLNYDPDVQSIPASKFLTFAKSKNLFVPIKKSQIEIYGSNLQPIRTEVVNSPLVVSLRPSKTGYKEDVNGVKIVAPDLQNIKVTITSDMTSANQTKTNRIYIPMVFGYVVPYNPSLPDLFAGVQDAVENPLPAFTEFFTNYWFLSIMLLAFALIVSLIYANFRKGGGVKVNNVPFTRGDKL